MVKLFRRRPPRSARPRLESLEDRRLLACSVTIEGDFLKIKGDNNPNTISIVDNGTASGITVTCDGLGVVTTGGHTIRRILVDTKDGNDRVEYRLTGNLRSGVSRDIEAQ